MQLQVARSVQLQSVNLWGLLDPSDLDGSALRWLPEQLRVVLAGRRTSALVAAAAYRDYRVAEVGEPLAAKGKGLGALPGGVTIPLESRVSDNALIAKVSTSLRVTGPVKVKQSRMVGRTVDRSMGDALASVVSATQRHVLDGGRMASLSLMRSDPRVRSYARVTGGDACAFCGLLAARGAVFLSEASADFASHDNCGCGAEAIYDGTDWQPSGESAAWQERYAAYSADSAGAPSVSGFAKWMRAAN